MLKKRWLPLLGLLPVLLLLLTAATLAGDPPIATITQADHGWIDPTGRVDANTLEQLRNVSDKVESEGFQLAGVFENDIASDPSHYASDVGNQNGIGSANKDNGILILVLLDRSGNDGNTPYIFVATGRGIQGLLPDAKVTEFRDAYFNPLRAQGKWQDGLVQLSTKLAEYLATPNAQEFSDQNLKNLADGGSQSQGDSSGWVGFIIFLIMIMIILPLAVFRRHYGSSSSSGGSGNFYGGSSSWSSSSDSYGGGGSFDGGGSGG